jgi:hypothetical protein
LAGFGFHIVKKGEGRKKTLEEFSFTVLPSLIDLVTHAHRHLDPESLIIKGFVKSNKSMTSAFSIKQSGKAIFIPGDLH